MVFGQQENRLPGEKKKLNEKINSTYVEVRPLISEDGETLYFSRRNHPRNAGGLEDFQDVWIANKDKNGNWKQAVNPGEPVNNNKINALMNISPDGKEAVFYNNYFGLIRWNEKPLTKFTRKGTEWQEGEDVKIKNFYNDNNYVDFYYSFRHDVILMAVERSGDTLNQGGQDLYLSFREKENTWQTPVNLGKAINTPKSDFAPFLTPDGKGLFFVSSGHDGEGGNDIFFAKRLDESWYNWSEPVNLGAGINSSGEETYFSITSDYKNIYFESYNRGAGDRDIYKAGLPKMFSPPYDIDELREEVPEDLVASKAFGNLEEANNIVKTTENQDASNEEITNSSGASSEEKEVANENNNISGKPLNAAKRVNNKNREGAQNNLSSNSMKSGEESGQQQNKHLSNTSLSQPGKQESGITEKITKTIPYVKIEKGTEEVKFEVLRNIYFDFNRTSLDRHYHKKMDRISRLLQEEKGLWVKLKGYTDAVGNSEINQKISRKRAENVARYLAKNGISKNRIQIVGHGEQDPIATNDDEKEGRELNRRVEISLVLPFR